MQVSLFLLAILMIEPNFPPPDPERGKRIVSDVIDLMKLQNNEATRSKVNRWLELTLGKAQRMNRLPWWFARRLFACIAYPGQDVFDLQGDIDKVIALFCEKKLKLKSIGFILECRAEGKLGKPLFYALHGGRIHLWPAPNDEVLLAITYAKPLTVEMVPVEWESCLIDGVIGFYGKYFDRSGLLENPDEFSQRFMAGIRASRSEHFDTESFDRHYETVITKPGLTSFQAYTEISMADYDNAIIAPSYNGKTGEIQILANKDEFKKNQRGISIAQIKGNRQP